MLSLPHSWFLCYIIKDWLLVEPSPRQKAGDGPPSESVNSGAVSPTFNGT